MTYSMVDLCQHLFEYKHNAIPVKVSECAMAGGESAPYSG